MNNLNGVKITKKNEDGSYDYSDSLFESVDAYGGDHVNRILELSPSNIGKQAKYVKFRLSVEKNGSFYPMLPIKENSYQVTSEYYRGFTFYLEDSSGVKYTPDKNGVISITNILASPIDVVLHLIVDQYSIQDFEQTTFLDNAHIHIWSR